jgi:integrase
VTRFGQSAWRTAEIYLAMYQAWAILKILGHAYLRTTMIYTHCVPSKTAKEAKSPLGL